MEECTARQQLSGLKGKGPKVEAHQEGRQKEHSGRQTPESAGADTFSLHQPGMIMNVLPATV
jgi:hypothetical protein